METGTINSVEFTRNGAGNQWTTIDGKRYATWWDARRTDWRVGDIVTFDTYQRPLWSGNPPVDCAQNIRKARSA